MNPTVFLNGQYLPADQALISPMDRGFIFSDGVYEVVQYYGGRPFAMAQHLQRLQYSLSELRIVLPPDAPAFDEISDQLIKANDLPDGYVYWQVTRGVAMRDHRFPDPPVAPTQFAFCKPSSPLKRDGQLNPMTAITHPEIRWAKCAIKAISLLPNVLAAQTAKDAGAAEAIFIRPDGHVAEGTSRSVFAVIDGVLRTHPLDGSILGSITRQIVIDLARELNIPVTETAFTSQQMMAADELFVVGTTTNVRPVLRVDDQPINHQTIGPITQQLATALIERIARDCRL